MYKQFLLVYYSRQVWLYLVITMLIVVASLYGIICCISRMNQHFLKDENKFTRALAAIIGLILMQGTNTFLSS